MLQTSVIVLAAGLGKRMRSALPKVLHEIGGQPLLHHILDQIQAALPGSSVAIVTGHAREKVEASLHENSRYSNLKISFVQQPEQRGTGHAARCAMDSAWGQAQVKAKAQIVILPGDLPLITKDLVAQIAEPLGKSAMRLLTCELKDPTGYGRVVRKGKRGGVLRIVEEKDANAREKQIHEVGASIYSYQASFLQFGLQKLTTKNAQGEYYLTDVVAQAARAKKNIDVLEWRAAEDLRGINDPWELSQAARYLNDRVVKNWAQRGVRFIDPGHTWVDVGVELSEEVLVHTGAILSGNTRVGKGSVIGPRVVLKNMRIGQNTQIKTGTVGEESEVGDGCQVGPYAHLRPESKIGNETKIGNFVELKKTRVGEKTSIAHLSYLGDAEVGDRVNIGCGFITCNFDGRIIDGQRKHRTIIEDDVFLGSDCQTVAPVRLGKGAYVASGSTVTEDVESGALAIARSRQVNKPGYAKKLKT
jgi:bifunctional UDP-N-acetylglucosamine pyrophosphorylase / glucosamine-1-phosphate N-acetyltransferase